MNTYKITKQADKLIASRDASFNGNTKVTIEQGLSLEGAREKLLEMYNNDWGTDFKDWSPERNPESPFAYGQHPYGSTMNEDGTVSYMHNSRTYSIEEEREFGITAADEDSIFVWSSPFAKNFEEMPEVTDDMIVVVTNAQHTFITIYDVKGFSEHDIMRVIKRHCSYLCHGCNYTYKFIKKVGNCYFVK